MTTQNETTQNEARQEGHDENKSRGEQFLEVVFTPSRMSVIAEACSGNRFVTPDKVRATIAEAMLRDPKIAECYAPTVFHAALLVSRLDLDASGHHNGAAFVARKNWKAERYECHIQMGYGAMVDLATRDGRIRSFTVAEVWDCDEFEFRMGTRRYIDHNPASERTSESKLTHCYAIAWYPDNGFEFEVMSRQEIERIRDTYTAKYQNGDIISPAWKNEFGRQGCKTVLHRLIKRLPVNPVLAEALDQSHIADGMESSFNPRRMRVVNEGEKEGGIISRIRSIPNEAGEDNNKDGDFSKEESEEVQRIMDEQAAKRRSQQAQEVSR